MATTSPNRVSPNLADEQSTKVTELDDDVDVADAVLSGDFSGCDLLEPVFSECRFEQATFTGGALRYARLVDCVFSDCDLSGTTFQEGAFTRVEFRRCRASGLQAPRVLALSTSPSWTASSKARTSG